MAYGFHHLDVSCEGFPRPYLVQNKSENLILNLKKNIFCWNFLFGAIISDCTIFVNFGHYYCKIKQNSVHETKAMRDIMTSMFATLKAWVIS